MSSTEVLLHEADVCLLEGKLDLAIEELESLKLQNLRTGPVYSRLARGMALRGRFLTVLSLYLEWADTALKSDDLKEAELALGFALALRPASVEVHEMGLQIARQAHDLPLLKQRLVELAFLLLECGEGDRSVALIEEAIQCCPEDEDLAQQLAELYMSLGQIKLAVEQYERCAAYYLQHNLSEKHIHALRKLKLLKADEADILLRLGGAYLENGDLDEAELEFRAVLRVDLQNLSALLQLSRVSQMKGNFRSAILALNKVLQVDPESAEAHRRLGEIYLSKGEQIKGLQSLFRAAQLLTGCGEKLAAGEVYKAILCVEQDNNLALSGLLGLGLKLPILQPQSLVAQEPEDLEDLVQDSVEPVERVQRQAMIRKSEMGSLIEKKPYFKKITQKSESRKSLRPGLENKERKQEKPRFPVPDVKAISAQPAAVQDAPIILSQADDMPLEHWNDEPSAELLPNLEWALEPFFPDFEMTDIFEIDALPSLAELQVEELSEDRSEPVEQVEEFEFEFLDEEQPELLFPEEKALDLLQDIFKDFEFEDLPETEGLAPVLVDPAELELGHMDGSFEPEKPLEPEKALETTKPLELKKQSLDLTKILDLTMPEVEFAEQLGSIGLNEELEEQLQSELSFSNRTLGSQAAPSDQLCGAELCFRFGRFEEAREEYLALQKLHPESAEIAWGLVKTALWMEEDQAVEDGLWQISQLNFERGNWTECQDRLGELLSLRPEHKEARLLMVDVFLLAGQSKIAAWHLGQMSDRWLLEQDWESATSALQKLLEISPSDPARERLADVYESQNRGAEALLLRQQLVASYLAGNRIKEAVKTQQKVVDLVPDSLHEREELISLLKSQSCWQEAREQQLILAASYKKQGAYDSACGVLREILRFNEECFEAEKALIHILLESGRVTEAEKQAEGLAERFRESKDYLEGIELFELWVRYAPSNPRGREHLAQFYQLQGDLDAAKLEWLLATESHHNLADYESSARTLEMALELDPEQGEWRFRLAKLKLEQLDNTEDALLQLRRLSRSESSPLQASSLYFQVLGKLGRMSELGEALQRIGHSEEALELKAQTVRALQDRLLAEPLNLDLKFAWGEFCLALELLDSAIEHFQILRREPSYSFHAYRLLGKCFAKKPGLNMTDLAIKQFQKGLFLGAPSTDDLLLLRYDMAQVLIEQGRVVEAKEQLEICRELQWDYRDVEHLISEIEGVG